MAGGPSRAGCESRGTGDASPTSGGAGGGGSPGGLADRGDRREAGFARGLPAPPPTPKAEVRPDLGFGGISHTNSWVVGLIVSSLTFARAGSVAASSTAAATSSGCNMRARCSGVGGTGRRSRIGVSTSPG